MKTKEQIETKIARSKARVKARNAWKESRRVLQGAKMLISKEEAEVRDKAGKKPITPKKWKEDKQKALLESRKIPRVKPKDFYSEELKLRRKAKRERMKAVLKNRDYAFIPQTICYPAFSKVNNKQATAQAKIDTMVINIRQANTTARKQSKEDKAKHKASLAAFKETYKRTYNNEPVDRTNCHRQKKNRSFARKSTAKIYSMKKVKQAA